MLIFVERFYFVYKKVSFSFVAVVTDLYVAADSAHFFSDAKRDTVINCYRFSFLFFFDYGSALLVIFVSSILTYRNYIFIRTLSNFIANNQNQ